MRKSKDINPLLETKIGYRSMLLVAKEAKEKGHLNFNKDEVFCPQQAIFSVNLTDFISGTVTLWPNKHYTNLVDVILEAGGVLIQGQLYWTCEMPRPWLPYKVSFSRELPDYVIALAQNPITMVEVLA